MKKFFALLAVMALPMLASAQSQGLAVHIVTQFSFDAKPIIRWIDWLRTRGIHLPVKVGLAGPASCLWTATEADVRPPLD